DLDAILAEVVANAGQPLGGQETLLDEFQVDEAHAPEAADGIEKAIADDDADDAHRQHPEARLAAADQGPANDDRQLLGHGKPQTRGDDTEEYSQVSPGHQELFHSTYSACCVYSLPIIIQKSRRREKTKVPRSASFSPSRPGPG